jgi:hypothetical protein
MAPPHPAGQQVDGKVRHFATRVLAPSLTRVRGSVLDRQEESTTSHAPVHMTRFGLDGEDFIRRSNHQPALRIG